MKKTAVIFLLFLYSLSSFGIGVRQFYCCGKLKTTTLNILPTRDIACSGGESDDCCRTKYQFFKVKDSHFNAPEINGAFKQAVDAAPPVIPSWDLSPIRIALRNSIFPHAPPLPPCTPLYIQYCIYRI